MMTCAGWEDLLLPVQIASIQESLYDPKKWEKNPFICEQGLNSHSPQLQIWQWTSQLAEMHLDLRTGILHSAEWKCIDWWSFNLTNVKSQCPQEYCICPTPRAK